MNRTILLITGLFFALVAAGIIMESSSHNHSLSDKSHYENGCDGKCTIAIRETENIDSKELVATYKEWLKSDNEQTRKAAESELKRLGVTAEQQRSPAPSGKEEIDKASTAAPVSDDKGVETVKVDYSSIECSIQSDKALYDVWDRPIITVTLKNTGARPQEMRRNVAANHTEIKGVGGFNNNGLTYYPPTQYIGQFKDGKYGAASPLPPPPKYFLTDSTVTNDEPEIIPPGQAITLTYTFCNKLIDGKPFLNLGECEITAGYSLRFYEAQSNKIVIKVEAKPQDGPPINIIDSEWGPEENGLRIGLTAEKNSIAYGEPINLSLKIINVTNSLKQFYPSRIRENLTIVGQNGNLGKNISCGYQTIDSGSSEIARGQEIISDNEDITLYSYHICKPDKYTIQWRYGKTCSNKIEIEVKEGHSNPYAEIFCRLIHIMPTDWGTFLGGKYYSIVLVFPQCGIADNITVCHTEKPVNPNADSQVPDGSELIGQDKWGYVYLSICPNAGEKWPTAKQDIIKALEIH